MSSIDNIPAGDFDQPYAQVPLAAMAGLAHKKNALAVWICYRYHQGRNPHAFVSQQRIAQELAQDGHAISRTVVYHVTRWLVENGWLEKQQRGRRKTNLVACTIPRRFAQAAEQGVALEAQGETVVLTGPETADAQRKRVPITNSSEPNTSGTQTDQGSGLGEKFSSWADAVQVLKDKMPHSSLQLLDEAYLFEKDGLLYFAPGVPGLQQELIGRFVNAQFLASAEVAA